MRHLASLGFFLAVLVNLGAQTPLPSPSVDPAPGAYSAPVRLEVRAPEGAQIRYRFLETPSVQTFPWTAPLVLDALAGETRSYTLRLTTDLASGEALTQDYRYQVSRPAAAMATVQPVPGFFTGTVTVQPVLPPGWTASQAEVPPSFPLVLDALPGDRKSFTVTARGPLGEALDWTYVIDRRDQEAEGVDLVSPQPGAWANPQALVADFRGVDRVLWSWGDHFDPKVAQAYEGPVLLDRPGPQTLTLAGRSRADGHWVEKTVSWTNGTAAGPVDGWPVSGVRTSGLDLPLAPGWSLSWDEGRSWQPSQAVRTETASSVSRKVLAVQVKSDGAASRYVYWLDARAPEAPALQFYGGWNPRVSFSGASGALHRVTWTRSDGRTQEDSESLWGPVGSWKVPDGVVGARVTVQGANAVQGPEGTLGFAETGWATPGWEPWDQKGPQTDRSLLPLGGRVVSRPGFWPVYEVASQPSVAEPGPGSPGLTGAFLPTVPWGADRTFYVRFAWRDAAGLTGPALPPVAVRVDRVPPLAPEVLVVGAQVMVKAAEGEEEGSSLSWAVTSVRASTAEPLEFQPYKGPLDIASLRAGIPGPLWFHAQAQDRSGNAGPARLNVALGAPAADQTTSVVQVDTDPAVGETAVEDGGVYPWAQFRLRAVDPGRDLWVGVADQSAGLPADWKDRVQPWSGTVSRAVGRGERRTFLLYWNARTADGWAWPQPKTLGLTLDQGPPAAPVTADVWPTTPLGAAWTLTLKPGRAGDALKYSSTLDGSLPTDPVLGEPWPGTKTWDAPPAGKIVVRLRVAAVAVSGLSVEMPLGDPVTIDRSPPVAVAPALEPFTFRSGTLTVPSPPDGLLVRYTLTSDGSLPGAPSGSSPSVPPKGLVLEGAAGQSVLYRFRWRSFSAAGAPGPVSDTFSVLVDRTAPGPSVDAPETDPERAVPSPHLTGFPASEVSAAPVILKADWPVGTLRYEVREGVGTPRAVTALSPAWTQPLVLDGGAGVDRSFGISVRGFTADGRPLTEESRYVVRVDRSVPGTPSVVLNPDPRRPEAVLKELPGEAHPDEELLYRWFWESFPTGKGQSDWQALGDDPAVFTAPGGSLTRLRVQVFLRDEAGNEGPVAEKTLLIDQNVVYAAAGAQGTGSRANPLGSVGDAVDLAHREGKGILFLSSGNFPVGRTLDLGGLQVLGGLGTDLWEATASPGRSLLSAQEPFLGTTFLESGDRNWQVARVDLTTGSVPFDRVVLVRGASVSVKDCSWNWSGASGGWDQTGGTLDWSNVNAAYTAQPRGSFLDLRNSEATVRGFNLSALKNQGGVLIFLKDSKALFQDLVMVSKKAVDFDAVWSVAGGTLTVNTARILAGDGATRATAVLLRDAEAVFWNSEVALYGSSSNTGFQTTHGRLEVQKTNLSLLNGKEFNQGFVVDHGDAVLRSLQVKVDSGAYQGGLSLDGGSLTMAASKVQLAGGGQRVWGSQFLDTCLVKLDDVTWTLAKKTPGDLWKVQKPWAEGSAVTGSITTGWQ